MNIIYPKFKNKQTDEEKDLSNPWELDDKDLKYYYRVEHPTEEQTAPEYYMKSTESKVNLTPDTWAKFSVLLERFGLRDKEASRVLGAWVQVIIETSQRPSSISAEDQIKLLLWFIEYSNTLLKFLDNHLPQIPDEVLLDLEGIVDNAKFKLISERVKIAYNNSSKKLLLAEVDLSKPRGYEKMFGVMTPALDRIPEPTALENIDLFSGLELQINENTRLRARLVHPNDLESISSVGKMRALGYKDFGADTFKQTTAEAVHTDKSFLLIVEMSKKSQIGEYHTVPHSTISVEFSGEVEGEKPLTEAFRLMTDKELLLQEFWQFRALQGRGINIRLKEFANGKVTKDGIEEPILGASDRRSLKSLSSKLKIPVADLLAYSEIESLAFFTIPEENWELVFKGKLDGVEALQQEPHVDPNTFQFEYTLAMLVAGEAMRRYGSRFMGGMLHQTLREKIVKSTNVPMNYLQSMVLNPFGKNKDQENGTTYNSDYFGKFYKYFFKNHRSKLVGFEKQLRKLPLQEGKKILEILNDEQKNIEFVLEFVDALINNTGAKALGPILAFFDQTEYLRQIAISANNRLLENPNYNLEPNDLDVIEA